MAGVSKDLKLSRLVLVYKICLLFGFKGLQALAVLYRVGSTTINTLLGSMDLQTAGVSLGIHQPCIVAALGLVLAESSFIAKLVALEASLDI